MSKGVNKAILVGNLGADPDIKYTPGGAAVSTFSIATTESRKDKEGNWNDHTEWHKIVTWNKMAETASEYLKKGSQVYIEGRIQTRSWEDKEGNKRYQTEIVAQNLQMLGSKPSGSNSGSESTEETSDLPF